MGKQLILTMLLLLLAACQDRVAPTHDSELIQPPLVQCAKDIDCKGNRICESGKCAFPVEQVIEEESAALPIAESSSAPVPSPGSTLKRIFVTKNLQSNIEFFEAITGPARVSYDTERIYEVDGCEVIAIVFGERISAVGIKIKKNCSFDLNTFLPNYGGQFPAIGKLTMQRFQDIVGGNVEYYVPCFDCGTSMDPITYSHWIGTHSEGVLEVRLETQNLPYSVKEAIQNEGYDFNFNCKPNKFEALARRDPPSGEIMSIVVGYNIPTAKCN